MKHKNFEIVLLDRKKKNQKNETVRVCPQLSSLWHLCFQSTRNQFIKGMNYLQAYTWLKYRIFSENNVHFVKTVHSSPLNSAQTLVIFQLKIFRLFVSNTALTFHSQWEEGANLNNTYV